MPWTNTAWRRGRWNGWTEDGEAPPGQPLDPAHSAATFDADGGSPTVGALVGPTPAASPELDEADPWQWSHFGASHAVDRSPLDHSATGSHSFDTGAIAARQVRPVRETGLSRQDTILTITERETTPSVTASLRGKNSLPINNPEGLPTPVPHRRNVRDKRIYGGWFRQADGRVNPPSPPRGVRPVGGGSTRGTTVAGRDELVRPGFGRPGLIRRPPTDFDEDAVVDATDDAATDSASGFYTTAGW